MLFLALANCERTAPDFLWLLDTLHSACGLRTHALIGENGSVDNTRGLTRKDIDLIDPSFADRLERMARGRQFMPTLRVPRF
jgi:hypothetical protein